MKAGDRGRTGNIQLGRLTLYQLSYTRVAGNGVPLLCEVRIIPPGYQMCHT